MNYQCKATVKSISAKNKEGDSKAAYKIKLSAVEKYSVTLQDEQVMNVFIKQAEKKDGMEKNAKEAILYNTEKSFVLPEALFDIVQHSYKTKTPAMITIKDENVIKKWELN